MVLHGEDEAGSLEMVPRHLEGRGDRVALTGFAAGPMANAWR